MNRQSMGIPVGKSCGAQAGAEEEGLTHGADGARGALSHEAQRMRQEKATGKKLRIDSEDHSAVTVTDPLRVTHPMWDSQYPLSWEPVCQALVKLTCVISALPVTQEVGLMSPFTGERPEVQGGMEGGGSHSWERSTCVRCPGLRLAQSP